MSDSLRFRTSEEWERLRAEYDHITDDASDMGDIVEKVGALAAVAQVLLEGMASLTREVEALRESVRDRSA